MCTAQMSQFDPISIEHSITEELQVKPAEAIQVSVPGRSVERLSLVGLAGSVPRLSRGDRRRDNWFTFAGVHHGFECHVAPRGRPLTVRLDDDGTD